ncbi:kinesin-like protein KIF25 [Sminthopsis crassicaudata]|uniref:kinesin-like protein KIF25 n=1 Tax=Sminthopsis crassicaudata TaxID=9301 RepID=UPI003D6926BA
MPAKGLNWSFITNQRIQQLKHQVRAKEERIVELETENAVLHLKLAECHGIIGRSNSKTMQLCSLYKEEQHLRRNTYSNLTQIYQTVQKFKQELKDFQSFSYLLMRNFQHHYKDYLSQIVDAVQGAQIENENLQLLQARAIDLEQSLQEINGRYQVEKQKRKALHNNLVELRGNIRVHCRIRPLLPFDTESGDPAFHNRLISLSEKVVHATDDETVLVKCNRPGHPLVNKTFQFERVYNPLESQKIVFGDVCPLLTSLLDGYNVCIMTYGQTGSGKSYTMLGPHSESDPISSSEADQEMGIIPRAAGELFRLLSENQTVNSRVEVSVVEIYNNELFDLLAKDSSGIFGVKRDVITTKEGKSNVPLLIYELVESPAEFMRLINKSLQLRVKHPTLVHADSSRSHLVVTITLTISVPFDSFADQQSSQNLCKEILCITPQKVMKGEKPSFFSRGLSPAPTPLDPTEHQKQVQTKLQLVDLAGSECVGMSGVTGTSLRETSFINRSLAALADVLGALSEHRGHIPYRNSKLTHLLQDSIGGDAKLLVMLCVSPCQKYLAETLQSLGFGSRARQVQKVQAKRRNLLVSSKSK